MNKGYHACFSQQVTAQQDETGVCSLVPSECEELGRGGILISAAKELLCGGRGIQVAGGVVRLLSVFYRGGLKSCCSYGVKSAQHLLCCA